MLIKISKRANRGRHASPVSGLLQFNCSNSWLETACWADTDNPHAAGTLRADLHKGSDYTRVSPEPQGADICLIDSSGDLLLHLTLNIVPSVYLCLEHHGCSFEMRSPDTYSQCTGRTSQLCHALGRPVDDLAFRTHMLT